MPPKIVLRRIVAGSKEGEGSFVDVTVTELPSERSGEYRTPTGEYMSVWFDMKAKPQRVTLDYLPESLRGVRGKSIRTVQLDHNGVGIHDLGAAEQLVVDLGRRLNPNSRNVPASEKKVRTTEPPWYTIKESETARYTTVDKLVSTSELSILTLISDRMEGNNIHSDVFPYRAQRDVDFNGEPLPKGQFRVYVSVPKDPQIAETYNQLVEDAFALKVQVEAEGLSDSYREARLNDLIAERLKPITPAQ